MDTEAIKRSMMNAPWCKIGEFFAQGEAGDVRLEIRRPPPKVNIEMMARARREGLIDAQDKPTSAEAGLRFAAMMFSGMVFLPGAHRALFKEEEFIDLPFFEDLVAACTAALKPTQAAVEEAKGN